MYSNIWYSVGMSPCVGFGIVWACMGRVLLKGLHWPGTLFAGGGRRGSSEPGRCCRLFCLKTPSLPCTTVHFKPMQWNYFALNPALVVGSNLPARPKPWGSAPCLIQNFPAWPPLSPVAWYKMGQTYLLCCFVICKVWTLVPFRVLNLIIMIILIWVNL